MVLSVLERFMVLNCLPKEGNIVLLRLRQGLIDKVGLSSEEILALEVHQTPEGKVTWRNDLPQEVEIEITPAEAGVIKDALRQLDRSGKLIPDQLSIWKKFVEEGA